MDKKILAEIINDHYRNTISENTEWVKRSHPYAHTSQPRPKDFAVYTNLMEEWSKALVRDCDSSYAQEARMISITLGP
jgi:hypothetical protein